MEELCSLPSDYTTKRWLSKQYDTSTKIDTQMKQDREPRINPHIHGQLIYNKAGKNIQWRKERLSSTSGNGKT